MNISSDYASLRTYNSGLISASATKTDDATNTSSAGSYLEQLKSKFTELNLSAGDYSGGTTGTGVQGNVLISPKLIEKADNDPAVAAKLEEDLSGVADAEQWLKNQCAAQGMTLDACGIIIDEDGNMSSWSQVTTTSGSDDSDEVDSEKEDEEKRIEKKRQEKADAEREADEDAQAETGMQTTSSYYSEYEGTYDKLLSTAAIPFSLNTYA